LTVARPTSVHATTPATAFPDLAARCASSAYTATGKAFPRFVDQLAKVLLEWLNQLAFEEGWQVPQGRLLGVMLRRADSVLILVTVQPIEEGQRLVVLGWIVTRSPLAIATPQASSAGPASSAAPSSGDFRAWCP